MKIKSLLTAGAVLTAAAALAVTAGAYDLNKDLGTGWSTSITVPGDEFLDATTDSVFTVTFTVDESLADMDGHNYWCIKPMINDTGWPFIDTLVGPTLSDGKDSYVISTDDTEIKFTIPADELEHLQVAGMAFLGHGITLGTFSFSDTDTLPAPKEEAPAEEVAAEEVTAPAAGDVAAATESSKGSPDTGIADVAAVAGLAVVAAGAVVIAKKNK